MTKNYPHGLCIAKWHIGTPSCNEPSCRYAAASVMLNSSMMWITGGRRWEVGGWWQLDGSEYVTLGKTTPGPKLPYTLAYHCALKLNDKDIYFIGGFAGYSNWFSNRVFVHKLSDGVEYNWPYTEVKPMTNARMSHACAVMSNNEKKYIVVAGGENDGPLNTVEIYDPLSDAWESGKHIYQKQTIF